MLFTDLNGQLRMAIHSLNVSTEERFETAEFIPTEDLGYTIVLNDGPGWTAKTIRNLSAAIRYICSEVKSVSEAYKRFLSVIRGKCE